MRLARLLLTALHLSQQGKNSLATSVIKPSDTIATGDLIFVSPPYDVTSALDDAILASGEATVRWMRENGTPNATREVVSHVVLAWRNDAGQLSFVQALPPEVVVTPEADFWHMVGPGTVLYHAAPLDEAERTAGTAAAEWALAQVGKPYANDFEPPPDEFYCSSLVEWAYRQALASDSVFAPADFTLIFVPDRYWQRYYEAMGSNLPVNTTGSNPTLLLHSSKLTFSVLPWNGTSEERSKEPVLSTNLGTSNL